MAQRTDNLAVSKAILDQPAGDIGDFEVAWAQARATVAVAEQLAALVKLLGAGNVSLVVNP